MSCDGTQGMRTVAVLAGGRRFRRALRAGKRARSLAGGGRAFKRGGRGPISRGRRVRGSDRRRPPPIAMRRFILQLGTGLVLALAGLAATAVRAQSKEVIDLPTRPDVTQRVLLVAPAAPQAVALLFAGGHGGLGLYPNGSMRWGDNNFVVRTRELFVERGLAVAVVDAPSDRQRSPFLSGWRQSAEHAEDIGRLVEALRGRMGVPVWLVGTSRGTQSVAHLATVLEGRRAPDGIVLTSSILVDDGTPAVTAMPLERIRQPVLVVHHEADACALCPYSAVPALIGGLKASARAELLAFKGGISTGPVCAALAHHGFNGIEAEVVDAIVRWMRAR